MTGASVRASDADREQAVGVLRQAYAEGRLTLEEFEERTSAAYAARTWGALRDLTADLPVQPVFEFENTENTHSAGHAAARTGFPPDPVESGPPRAAQPPGLTGQRPAVRGRSFGPLLPVIFVWAVIAAASSSPPAAAALSCLFICLLAIRIARSGR